MLVISKMPCLEFEIDVSRRPGLSSASLGLRPACWRPTSALVPISFLAWLCFLAAILKGFSASAQREMEARSPPAKNGRGDD